MQVEMLKSQNGAGDPKGATMRRYRAGETYEVGDEMPPEVANVFVAEGWARFVNGGKDAGPAPENKMLGAAPENKANARRKAKGDCPKCGRHFEKGLHFHEARCRG